MQKETMQLNGIGTSFRFLFVRCILRNILEIRILLEVLLGGGVFPDPVRLFIDEYDRQKNAGGRKPGGEGMEICI